MSATGTAADRTIVEFPSGAGYRSVGRLVLGGIASRFELPIDRVDELLLAVDSLLLQPSDGKVVRLEAELTGSSLRVSLAPLRPGVLDDPALVRVLSRLVDELSERPDGNGAAVELVVSAAHRGGKP